MDGGDAVQVRGSNDKAAPPADPVAVVREAKTARRKGKKRPQSAPSKISRNPNPYPAGADIATRPPNNRKFGRTSRLGSRMREDVSNARSSSTPALRATTTNNGEKSANNMNNDDPQEQGRRRLELSRGSTATTVALGVDGDNTPSSDVKDNEQLQQLELRNQELQSRCRHLEQRCAHFEC